MVSFLVNKTFSLVSLAKGFQFCFKRHHFLYSVNECLNLFFGVLVLEGLVGLHRTVNFSFFSITGSSALLIQFQDYLV